MDSDHRHELKTNELADLLTHFPQFLKRNANTLIGLALIIIGLVTWPLLSKMSREKELAEDTRVSQSIQMLGQDIGAALQALQNNPEQLNSALNTILANAEALLDLSAETDNPNLSALASIKAAQAIRTELHLRNNQVSAETVNEQTQKAQEAYEKAAQKATQPSLQAMAQFGIGLCAEERGQAEQARDIYNDIVANEAFEPTVFPKMAQLRLDTLEENTESFTFADIPETEDVSTPETGMDTDILQVQPVEVQPGAGPASQESATEQPVADAADTPVSETDTTAAGTEE